MKVECVCMAALQSRLFSRSQELSSRGRLAIRTAERRAFDADGCVALRSVIDPRVIAEVSVAVEQLRHRDELAHDIAAYRQVFNSWRYSGATADLVFNGELGALAADLLGTRGVRLINDALLLKAPSNPQTDLHADFDFWSIAPKRALTFWIPLHDVDDRNGTLTVVPRSKDRPTMQLESLISSYRGLRLARKAWLRSTGNVPVAQTLGLGDLSIHDGSTLHASTVNRSERVRAAIGIHFMDCDAVYVDPKTAAQRRHAAFFGWDRLQPGDAFTDRIAPLIYRTGLSRSA